MSTLSPLQIFRAGTHTDQSGRTLAFSTADLAATASAYDPAHHEAPLVVGHPATDDPAYGWVAALHLQDGALEAAPRNVDPAFAELVAAERFNRISSSFFLPDAPGNPVPGVYYLRHVGFLGAAAPAVKGLRKPRFDLADEGGTVTLEFSLPESIPMPDPAVDFAAREAELKTRAEQQSAAFAARDAELAAREAALAKADAERARESAVAFAATHVQAGRLLPRQQAGLVELLLAVPAAPLEFADADGTAAKIGPRAWLEKFVAELPAQVDYAERTAPDASERPAAQFAAPPGFSVDPKGLVLHRRAQTLARQKSISYAQALAELTGGA